MHPGLQPLTKPIFFRGSLNLSILQQRQLTFNDSQAADFLKELGANCFAEIVTTSQSFNELHYFPNCDTLQARQPFGNYSVLLYLYFTVITFLIRLLCVTYRFRTTLTKNKQQFETHGFGCVSQQNIRNQMNHHG